MKRDPRLKRLGERRWSGRPMRTPHLHPVQRGRWRLQAGLLTIADNARQVSRDLAIMAEALARVERVGRYASGRA